MSTDAAPGDRDLLAVAGPVRRFAAARLHDSHAVDDVVQETMARLLDGRRDLEGQSLLAYALVVARNLIADHGRAGERERRHLHRLVDHRDPERPEEAALRGEERRALSAALAELPDRERQRLLDHELADVDMATLARQHDGTRGGMAAALNRTRAKARVDYVLALRRAQLPTRRCRPVLLALSAGDRRRQAALDAGRHLLTCSTCSALSEPLLQRRRLLAGVGPVAVLLAGPRVVADLVRQHPVPSIGTAAVTGAVAVAAIAGPSLVAGSEPSAENRDASPVRGTVTPSDPPPSSGPTSGQAVLTAAGLRLPPGVGTLSALAGQPVLVNGARVLDVPADEGFWVGREGQRVWVQLLDATESSIQFQPGQRLLFRARVVTHDGGFAGRVGVTPAEGAAELTAGGAHLEVTADSIQLR